MKAAVLLDKFVLRIRLFLDRGKRDELRARDFFRKGPMQAAASLRKQLRVDETTYRRIVGSSHSDPRAYFLYGVLDEVTKACTASMRWNEFLGCGAEELRGDDDPKQNDLAGRVVLEAVIDEQQMWTRKLIEILTDLICFSRTNEQPYFKTYLAAKTLDQFLRLYGDLKEFYSCENGNVESSIGDFSAAILDAWPGPGVSRPWFLRLSKEGIADQKKLLLNYQVFENIRPRFCSAIEIASDDERLTLGESYDRFFGGASRSIHSQIGALRTPANIEEVVSGMVLVGLLCLHVINRSYQLSGVVPQGVAKQLSDFWLSGDSVAPKIMALRQKALFEEGDLVFVFGFYLAEVLKVNSSKYGYKSYLVKYLVKLPLPGTPEECIPAMYVRRLVCRRDARSFFESELSKTSEGKEIWSSLKGASDSELFAALRKTLIELERTGVLAKMLTRRK